MDLRKLVTTCDFRNRDLITSVQIVHDMLRPFCTSWTIEMQMERGKYVGRFVLKTPCTLAILDHIFPSLLCVDTEYCQYLDPACVRVTEEDDHRKGSSFPYEFSPWENNILHLVTHQRRAEDRSTKRKILNVIFSLGGVNTKEKIFRFMRYLILNEECVCLNLSSIEEMRQMIYHQPLTKNYIAYLPGENMCLEFYHLIQDLGQGKIVDPLNPRGKVTINPPMIYLFIDDVPYQDLTNRLDKSLNKWAMVGEDGRLTYCSIPDISDEVLQPPEKWSYGAKSIDFILWPPNI